MYLVNARATLNMLLCCTGTSSASTQDQSLQMDAGGNKRNKKIGKRTTTATLSATVLVSQYASLAVDCHVDGSQTLVILSDALQ